MNDNNKHISKNEITPPKREKTLIEILQLIIKNKYTLISIIFVFVSASIIYSFIAKPKYEATVILKKESSPDSRRIGTQDISEMLSLQSLDQIETEMKLITTNTVISAVVDDLDLNVIINTVSWGKSKSYKVDKNFLECNDPAFLDKIKSKFILPELFSITFNEKEKPETGEFLIKKSSNSTYILYNNINNKKLSESYTVKVNGIKDSLNSNSQIKNVVLQSRDFNVDFYWSEAPVGSELSFTLKDFPTSVQVVTNKTKVSREGKTDIFSIVYSSSSALASATIANKIVDEFRSSRMLQKREAIRYSFDGVDKQLNEVQENLKKSENELSSFKASGQIMTIDASSQELIGFLSKLEAEKLNTDMQLSDYKNKIVDLEKELNKKGFFDPTYIEQNARDGGNSPFSQLLKQLSDLELQKLDLLQKRTENHPDVIAIDEQIQQTKGKLSGYNQNTIDAYKIMTNTLEKKLLKINDLMSKYEVKMQGLPSQENRLAQLLRQKGTYEKIFTILLDQREAMRIAELSRMQDITIVDEAKIPQDPSWPKKSLLLIISFILGGFTGVLLIFSKELYLTRFVNLDELENEFQIPILSIIPKYSKEIIKEINNSKAEYKIATLVSSDEGLIETYRLFRTKLSQKLNPEKKMIMITSCEENSGKTSVVSNLAISLAQEGKRILIVDCDLRKADLTKTFGLTTKDPGLIDFLTKDVNPKIYSRASKMIDILPTGGLTDESGTLLSSPRMKSLFANLSRSNYDIIIFDTPPVTRVVDPLVLAQYLDEAVIVVRPKHSLIETVRWGMQELKQANVIIKGVVANAATIETSYYYRYRYGYGYGYGKSGNPNGKKKTATKNNRVYS